MDSLGPGYRISAEKNGAGSGKVGAQQVLQIAGKQTQSTTKAYLVAQSRKNSTANPFFHRSGEIR